MSQPIKSNIKNKKVSVKKVAKKAPKDDRLPPKMKKSKTFIRENRKHQEYGTSKLEERFAKDFLDRLNVEYIYQFKAESIGRYYDFYLPKENICIEIDGDYYHSYGLKYEEMSPMQKRNKRVDEQKDHWALANGIPIIRIWEHDINNHPESVMKMLKENISTFSEKRIKEENKNKRH